MIRRPPRSTLDRSSAASDVYKRQGQDNVEPKFVSYNVLVEDCMLMGQDKKHIKFRFNNCWAVAFGKAEEWKDIAVGQKVDLVYTCLLYTSPSPRDRTRSRMPSSA